jgi:hypothetical protein
MPGYATGRLAIGVCDRCKTKRKYLELVSDGDKPGLRVCDPALYPGCCDERDPYRLPPRQPDRIVLRYPRPDVSIAIPPGTPSSADVEQALIDANMVKGS